MPITVQSQGFAPGCIGASTESGGTGCECKPGTEPRSRSESALRKASRIRDTGLFLFLQVRLVDADYAV